MKPNGTVTAVLPGRLRHPICGSRGSRGSPWIGIHELRGGGEVESSAMSHSRRLRPPDVRRVYELVGECEEQWDDPAAWQAHLAWGVQRLVHGPLAFWAVTDDLTTQSLPRVLDGAGSSELDEGLNRFADDMNANVGVTRMPDYPAATRALRERERITWRRRDLVHDRDYFGCEPHRRWLEPLGVHSYISSLRRLPDGSASCLAVHRTGDDEAFGVRGRRLVQLLHAVIGPRVGTRLTTRRDHSRRGLTPRLGQTLDRLLAGNSERQAAIALGISPTTVHGYVMELYRHFGVGSRSELLAYFIHHQPRRLPDDPERQAVGIPIAAAVRRGGRGGSA